MIDLGFHAFDEFFEMTEEIGFMKEAVRRDVAPVILFVGDTDRVSARSYPVLQRQIPPTALVTVDNEYVVRGELPAAFARGKMLRIAALPNFLKTYVDRLSFSFSDYLRHEKDSSTELHQWIRRNYLSFRELELSLILQGSVTIRINVVPAKRSASRDPKPPKSVLCRAGAAIRRNNKHLQDYGSLLSCLVPGDWQGPRAERGIRGI